MKERRKRQTRSGRSAGSTLELGDDGVEGTGVEDDGAEDSREPEARLGDGEARRRGGEHACTAREPRGVVKEPEVDHAQRPHDREHGLCAEAAGVEGCAVPMLFTCEKTRNMLENSAERQTGNQAVEVGDLGDDVAKGKNLAAGGKGGNGRHELGVEGALGGHRGDETRKEAGGLRGRGTDAAHGKDHAERELHDTVHRIARLQVAQQPKHRLLPLTRLFVCNAAHCPLLRVLLVSFLTRPSVTQKTEKCSSKETRERKDEKKGNQMKRSSSGREYVLGPSSSKRG